MSNVADMHGIKDGGSIKLKANPFSNIGKQDVLNSALDVPATAYKICNSSHISSTQYSSIGNSILKPGIPKLSAHEVSDDVSICPVILHPTKQLSSQVMNNDLVKTIGFPFGRSQITTQHQSRIVSSFQRSMIESQNVSPLIITPKPHNVTHTSNNDIVSSKAKIVPIPSTPLSSHFSVINKSVPEYTGARHNLVPSYYSHSDFARFPNKNSHKVGASPAILHGPITSDHIEDTGLIIPNSQHVFKPIISPRPSILRKRDADGVLRAQKNLIPILTKPDLEVNQNSDNRNGYSESGLQIDSIMVPQIPEVVLPRISALTNQSHMMVEISPRKKPRKQLLPANQESSFKIVGDEMVYIEEKFPKNDKIKKEFSDENAVDCNENRKNEDLEDDDLDDVDDNCPMDDEFDDDNINDDDHFADGFDYKSNKPFSEEAKGPADHSDDSSSCLKSKNKRPTLLGSFKNRCQVQSHHFHKYTDFKIKETKKQLAELQQTNKWLSDSRSAWRVRYLLKQFIDMGKNEVDIVEQMNELLKYFEKNIHDLKIRHTLIELVKDNIQRSKVTKDGIEEIIHQLNKIFQYKPLIDDVVDKYCPKELKKKNVKVLNK